MTQASLLFEATMGDILFDSALATEHLLVVGSLPRSLLDYCREIRRAMPQHSTKVPSADVLIRAYETILRSNEEGLWNSPTLLAQLLALCFSVRKVSSNHSITYFDARNVEKTVSMVELSNSGMCLYDDIPGETGLFISVPYMAVHLFARLNVRDMRTEEERYLLCSVQWLVNNVDHGMYNKQPWQSFEDFSAAFTACRINALLVLGDTTASVCELWGGGMSRVAPELRVKLLPVSVVRVEETLSDNTSDFVHELRNTGMVFRWRGCGADPLRQGYVVRNGDNGKAIDSWVSLPLETDPDRDVLCAEQAKFISAATISLTDVAKLSSNIMSAVSTSKSPTDRTTVVACVCNPYPSCGDAAAESLPANTVVVVREHLHRHFGMFHRHPAISPFVDINTCGKQRLATLGLSMKARGAGGSKAAVDRVLQRRTTSKFSSIDQFMQFMSDEGISVDKSRLVCLPGAPRRTLPASRSFSTLCSGAANSSGAVHRNSLRPYLNITSRTLTSRTFIGLSAARIVRSFVKVL